MHAGKRRNRYACIMQPLTHLSQMNYSTDISGTLDPQCRFLRPTEVRGIRVCSTGMLRILPNTSLGFDTLSLDAASRNRFSCKLWNSLHLIYSIKQAGKKPLLLLFLTRGRGAAIRVTVTAGCPISATLHLLFSFMKLPQYSCSMTSTRYVIPPL